ncbi:MAG: hypothetical protein KDJ26_00050 [Alphaproteobacteria bacterium]|nr:hypothetical protein [Alphaproteobacteria bacterium]MCB9985267.1 hypothetical protein [Micavibrio sp.]HPQ51055.1 hypothetical protein [Alphaproteobacteria bacterium]
MGQDHQATGCRYKSFVVGHFGDRAGVQLELVEPVTTQSSKPIKGRKIRRGFVVLMSSEVFNRQSLISAYQQAAEGDRKILREATLALKAFVKENGETNPREFGDWGEAIFSITPVRQVA